MRQRCRRHLAHSIDRRTAGGPHALARETSFTKFWVHATSTLCKCSDCQDSLWQGGKQLGPMAQHCGRGSHSYNGNASHIWVRGELPTPRCGHGVASQLHIATQSADFSHVGQALLRCKHGGPSRDGGYFYKIKDLAGTDPFERPAPAWGSLS